jgi:hypothetical protein
MNIQMVPPQYYPSIIHQQPQVQGQEMQRLPPPQMVMNTSPLPKELTVYLTKSMVFWVMRLL